MPPKKQPAGASKKTEQKKQERVIEDKTFGLKNKKGTKQQRFIQNVQHQVKHGTESREKIEADKFKKAKEDPLMKLDSLLKPVMGAGQKQNKDVDPKSVLCAFYKQGMCQKGPKCKFSHDLSIEFKAEKKNLYVDVRENKDSMDDWDEAMLNEVIDKKHAEKDKLKPKTAIICKFFLEAVEESKYGWFWECPNGDTCIYRHCLPQGYVLKKDKKKLADEAALIEEVSLEELIETERAALNSASCTKVTIETFIQWKKRKVREKQTKKAAAEKKKKAQYKAGRDLGLSGRELFTFNPELVGQDDEEADETTYEVEKDEDAGDEDEGRDVGDMFRVEDDGEVNEFGDQPGPSNGIAINEDLFDADEIPDEELDNLDLSSDSDPDAPGPSSARS